MATYTTKQQKAVLDCLSERADSPVSAAASSTMASSRPSPAGQRPQGHDGRGRVLSVLHPRLRIGLLPL